jgi:hypothetical protein
MSRLIIPGPGAGGGGSGAMTLISSQTVSGSSTPSITFSSIPGTYNHLKLIVNGALSAAINAEALLCQLNGDTGAHYTNTKQDTTGSAGAFYGAVAQPYIILGLLPDQATATGTAACFDILFPAYTSTVFNKLCLSQYYCDWNPAVQYDQEGGLFMGDWLPATPTAITSIKLYSPGVHDLAAGTTAWLYGIT